MSRRFLSLALLFAAACSKAPEGPTVSVTTIPGHGTLSEDTSTKEPPRLMLAEAYMRSYLSLFGGLSAIDTQLAMRGKDSSSLFDTWNDYLLTLGFADYRIDIPRQAQPNAVMVASFERVGVALCDRALEHDWKASPQPSVDKRVIFAFDMPAGTPTQAQFATGFDVLHRTFLGYPAALAPTDRVARFYTEIYSNIVAQHTKATRFTAAEAGWAAVCYGLVRHPEFHLY